jgi:hypothetical protein
MKPRQRPPYVRSARRTPCLRTILTIAAATILVAAIPASANAAVRTGSAQDPQGDASALSGPAPDIKSIAVRYDDAAGALRVTWTYYTDIRANAQPNDHLGGGFIADAPVVPMVQTDTVYVGWSAIESSGGSWPITTTLQIMGASGSLAGTGTMSEDGRVVTAEFTSPMLAGHDLQKGQGGFGSGDDVGQFWFDGYSDPHPPTPPTGPGSTRPQGQGGNDDADQGMTINSGAQYTNDPDVTLSIIAPSWASSFRLANDGGFRPAKTFPVRNTIRWRLAESGPERLPKTVYLRFGSDAQTFTDDIILDQTKPTVSSATLAPSGASASTTVAATAARTHTYRVRIHAKDRASGVAKVQFARNKRHPSRLGKFGRSSVFKATGAPKYVRVQDGAGNLSGWRAIR